jgi:hypothetical protein
VLLFALAYVSPYFSQWQYNQLDTNAFLSAPAGDHWFGTTQNGFDMFALTMRGMQKSLIIGLVGALIATSLAAIVGYEKSAGFAVPFDDPMKRIIETLSQGKEVEYGFLGVTFPNEPGPEGLRTRIEAARLLGLLPGRGLDTEERDGDKAARGERQD